MLAIITNYKPLEFVPPENIDQEHYAYLRENLIKEKNYKIKTMVPFWPRYKYYSLATLIFFIPFIFLAAVSRIDKTDRNTLVYGIPLFLVMIGSFPLWIFISRMITYITYRIKENNYFSDIKKAIANSQDYDDFVRSLYTETQTA